MGRKTNMEEQSLVNKSVKVEIEIKTKNARYLFLKLKTFYIEYLNVYLANNMYTQYGLKIDRKILENYEFTNMENYVNYKLIVNSFFHICIFIFFISFF